MRKIFSILLATMLIFTLSLGVFAEGVADDATFTFETIAPGEQSTAFWIIDADGFTLCATNEMSYKGQSGLEVKGKGWYNPGGSGNACVLMGGDAAAEALGGELPRGCTITWNVRVPKESGIVEFHTGSSTVDDAGNGVFDACAWEDALFLTSKDKGQWKSVSYTIPNRKLGDTFLKAISDQEINGVAFYIDSVVLKDRNGKVLRSSDVDDTKLGGVADEEPPEHIYTTGISLDRTTMNLQVGQIRQLGVNITPSDAEKKDVKWEASDTSILMVENGKVTALKEGECVITVTTLDTGISATLNVTVVKAAEKPQEPDEEIDVMLYVLIGAGVLFAALVVVLVIVLVKKKKLTEAKSDNSPKEE